MRLRTAVIALVVTLLAAGHSVAQIPGAELGQVQVTREALLDLQRRLDEAAASSTYSGELRARARELAERVRLRLADGDLQVGDRVLLQVQGETALTDTFIVRPGRVLRLPNIPDVPVQGVLRSELSDHLTRELANYVRNPVVQAQSLLRVTITGAIGAQGFYTVPVEAGVNEVFLVAGGISNNAEMTKIRIERGREVLYQDEQIERVITLGTSLDALGLQAGDRFVVPASKPPRNWWQLVTLANFLLTLPLTIIALGNAFGN